MLPAFLVGRKKKTVGAYCSFMPIEIQDDEVRENTPIPETPRFDLVIEASLHPSCARLITGQEEE